MRSIKMLGLAALAALMAMAFVGVSSAMAGSTLLCKVDEKPCILTNVITHVHETSVTDALLLNSLGNVKCAVLFLGDGQKESEENAQIILGNFTYSSCFRKKLFGGEESCTVKELSGPAAIKVLRESHETAKVTGEGEVELTCGTSINCVYNGEGLAGTAKGPLLSIQKNGEVTITNGVTHKVKGSLCPEEGKLDINTTPLEATYITEGLHYCVKYDHAHGYYEDPECKKELGSRTGNYMLVDGPAGKKVGEHLCANLVPKPIIGLYEDPKCEKDDPTDLSLYELGEIVLVQ